MILDFRRAYSGRAELTLAKPFSPERNCSLRRVFMQPYEVTSTRKSDDMPIRMIVRLIKELHPGDEIYVQLMNIIMRKCLECWIE